MWTHFIRKSLLITFRKTFLNKKERLSKERRNQEFQQQQKKKRTVQQGETSEVIAFKPRFEMVKF
jgi:hypothetical protein